MRISAGLFPLLASYYVTAMPGLPTTLRSSDNTHLNKGDPRAAVWYPGNHLDRYLPPPYVVCDTPHFRYCFWQAKMRESCDYVANEVIERTDTTIYTGFMDPHGFAAPGTPLKLCWFANNGYYRGGCGFRIEGGPACNRTGNQLWWDYQDIKAATDEACSIMGNCGTKLWFIEETKEVCKLIVDHMVECTNSWRW